MNSVQRIEQNTGPSTNFFERICPMKIITSLALFVSSLASVSALAADAPAPMTTPAMSWPLKANPKPTAIDTGLIGKVHVTGVVSGLAYTQSNATAADEDSRLDMSNAQVFIQKTDGPVQFFAQIGEYSIPALGTAYARGDVATDLYSWIPQAYIKIAPTDNFSIQVGKMPTLIGAEYTFTYQNANIQRGLLWNQENAVNRGVQVNYSTGPIAVSVSVNDGFYSENYNWLSGLVSYTIDSANVITVAGGANLGESSRSTTETPLLQNNSGIYNVMYSHTTGPWTIAPYLQYSHVDKNASVGITDGAATLGAALLTNYAVNDKFNIASRLEYIDSTGSGASNLLYGAGSSAWSATLTPTYQQGIYFVRGEASYVQADDTAAGAAFGKTGDDDSQGRLMIETGILF
jgi:Putative beta-barrel porin-2, OmpL-like. bbp2